MQVVREVADSKSLIEDFISSRVADYGLDRRTEKAYRLDLEHFYLWAEQKQTDNVALAEGQGLEGEECEEWMEAYLEYLNKEKKLSSSTLYRKNRVLGYYLSYLAKKGIIPENHSLKPVETWDKKSRDQEPFQRLLSRKEADAFFKAMDREYGTLDSEFRRRVCLRDMVMMELLFFHRIEISELLRIQVSDYNPLTGNLVIRRKRGKDCSIHLFSQELQRKMGLWLDERKGFRRDGEYSEWMFLSKLGKPLSMEMMIQIFDKYRRLAGIEKKLTPKDLKESGMKQYARELIMERCR